MASFLLKVSVDVLIWAGSSAYYAGKYLVYGREPTEAEKIQQMLEKMTQQLNEQQIELKEIKSKLCKDEVGEVMEEILGKIVEN